jgi:leader peptidase (prepilin peptidase) / N-methyltransferase
MIFGIIICGIYGLFFGSFLNVLIDRLPNNEDIVRGRSHCDYCKKTLRWYELIPLFSFMIQRGKCRRCHKKLSIQYPLIELITGIGFSLIFYYSVISLSPHFIISLFYYLLIFSILLVLFVTDLKTQLLPEILIILGIMCSIIYYIYININSILIMNYIPIANNLLSAIGASLFFLIIWLVTKRRGMGFGDVELGFLLGLICGFPEIIFALYIAFLTGALVGVILIIGKNETLKSKIAFGPFLITGTLFALLFQVPLTQMWHRLFYF